MSFIHDLLDTYLDECICGHIEVATALLGLFLLVVHGTGFVKNDMVLQLSLLALAAAVGLDQYVMRRLRTATSTTDTEDQS